MLQQDRPAKTDPYRDSERAPEGGAFSARWWSRLALGISRGAAILRYHQFRQIWTRLRNRLLGPIERRIWRPRVKSTPPVRSRGASRSWRLSNRRRAISRHDLARGRIRLLNRTADLGFPIDWQLLNWPDAPRLWRFHLHYHEFLADLLDDDASPASWTLAWNIVGQWIEAHPPSDPTRYRDALHPYCISRRLPIWMRLFLEQQPPRDLKAEILRSMTEQVEYLQGHPERDVGGNHWWENGRALTIAGCFFAGARAERWRQLGMRWLDRCIAEQISANHEHFERSPMYQADLAIGLEQLAHWLEPVDPAASKRYREISADMLRFLDNLRHPDGNLPLFGDTTLDEAPLPAGRDVEDVSHWVGDYYVHRTANHQLNFDAGNLGPDHLPAHAHSDLLGFEMSLHGRRILVDSGTYAYEGRKRIEYRSSRAHNVLVIDEMELADVWSSFRMGRRGHVKDQGSGEIPEGRWVHASHDAYRHHGVDKVVRLWFFARDQGPWFSVHLVLGAPGKVHRMTEYLHWHPSVPCEIQDRSFISSDPNLPLAWEVATDDMDVTMATGSYSPDFHVEHLTKVFELSRSGSLPMLTAWSMRPAAIPASPWVFLAGGELVLSWLENSNRGIARIPLRMLGIAESISETAKEPANAGKPPAPITGPVPSTKPRQG